MVTRFEIGDWVKFRRTVISPTHGWQGAKHGSVGFVQRVLENDNLVVSFCSGMAHLLANEVIKTIPLDRGQLVRLKASVKEPRSLSLSVCVCAGSRTRCWIIKSTLALNLRLLVLILLA